MGFNIKFLCGFVYWEFSYFSFGISSFQILGFSPPKIHFNLLDLGGLLSRSRSQCPYKKKKKKMKKEKKDQVVASKSTEINDFMEKFEKGFSLFSYVSYNSTTVYYDNVLWLVESSVSSHMMGMRLVF